MCPIPVGISGSRAAAILGLSQYSTPFTVWQEIMEKIHGDGWNAKHGYVYEPFEGNENTEWGKAFEDAIITLTEQTTGDDIINREKSCSLPGMNYVTCHIDGQFERKKSHFEGKSANHRAFGFSWGEPGTDRVPQTYQVQNQHSMMITGTKETTMGVLVFPKTVQEWTEQGWKIINDPDYGYVMVLNESNNPIYPEQWARVFAQAGFFHLYHVEAKPDVQKLLKDMYSDFWNKYVLTGVAPEAVDYDDIKRLFPSPKGTLVISDSMKIGGESVADMMREYKNIGKEIGGAGHLKKRQTFIKTQVLKFAKDETTVADDDCQERIVFRDEAGGRLGSFNGKMFRS